LAGWEFDSDEREALENILKDKFDNKQIDIYLTLLEFICFQMKIWDEEILSNKDVKSYINTIFNSINKTNEYLSLLEKEQLAKGVPFGFPHFLGSDRNPEDRRHSRNFDRYVKTISNSAKASRISLEELKSQIERQLLESKTHQIELRQTVILFFTIWQLNIFKYSTKILTIRKKEFFIKL